jgi:transposase
MDAKDKVKVGEFSRKGKTRIKTQALDHDFQADEIVTPYGLFLPEYNETYLYLVQSFASSDFMVDSLINFWKTNSYRFLKVKKLLINLDNGGENSSRRTQFMKRIVEFVDETGIEIELVYYPPYHSKYNPVERVWGVLEKHWNGALLNTINTVIEYAKTMTYNNIHPVVQLVTKSYSTGVKLTKKEMNKLEERFVRLTGLEKWFVKIPVKT